jgi:HK97 gp10 family phage protein
LAERVVVELIFNKFPAVKGRLRRQAAEAIAESAVAVEQDVKGGPHSLYRAYPPSPHYDRTGNLGRSYHHRKINDLLYVVENDPNIAPYAIYVEFGTSRMAARPHLKPAAEAEAPKLKKKLEAVVGNLG